MPPVDIYQTSDHELVLNAELPDMTREDIDINIENFVLTIRGEKKPSTDVKEEQYHHVERRYGAFERVIPLSSDIDLNKAKATFKKGVLKVTLPKTENARSTRKTIPVEG